MRAQNMANRSKAIFLSFFLLMMILVQISPVDVVESEAQLAEFSGGIRVYGLVNNPLNLSDVELSSMPRVSEVAVIKCVWGFPGDLTVNWTGIPLFHILLLAGIRPEATKVAFHSRLFDFHSDLKVEDAFNSDILIAAEANGVPLTSLAEVAPDHMGGYRVVVPGRYGYKWVANLASIEVVDYDYLGTYESPPSQGGLGMDDEAIIPESKWTPEQKALLPAVIVPSLEAFTIPYGNRSFEVQTFTNASVSGFHFDVISKSVAMNFIVPFGSSGFADVIIQQTMLAGPYETFLDGDLVSAEQANVSDLDFQHVTLSEGIHSLRIVGTEFRGNVPSIIVAPLPEPIYVGKAVVFDARNSQDSGVIVAFTWSFGDNTSGSGAVVSHVYSNSGTFTVNVSAVDNFGGISSRIFDVTVQKQPFDALIFIGIGFATATIIAVIVLIMLLMKRKKRQ
jgi:hypothetical protein